MLMIFNLQREFLLPLAPREGAPGRSSMREHGGIINIECPLVKSMDERRNSYVARAGRPEGLPLLLFYKRRFGEYSLTKRLYKLIISGK
jgi:hypothetical protein